MPTAEAGAKLWRASRYELCDRDDPASIRVSPDASWKRFTPFSSYRQSGKAREVEAGPHLAFLRLKKLWEDEADLFRTALLRFATGYGFLGAFEEDHLQRPVLPEGKNLIAPEATIDNQGRLRRFDPATEGKSLLRSVLVDRGWRIDAAGSTIALPSEVLFTAKNPDLDSELWPTRQPRQLVPWEEVQRGYGALMNLDLASFKGVSVLCTREPLRRWTVGLRFFPSGDTPIDDLIQSEDYGTSLNFYLRDVSPFASLGGDGSLQRGWRYRSLNQAMYVMLYLDLTGGSTIKKCQSRGCPNYFRAGPQLRSVYCSKRCANRASTRIGRGQEP